MTVSLPRYRFSVGEYEQIGSSQILDEAARVELIDGEIVEMGPIGPLHGWSVTLLSDHVGAQARPHALLSVQNPIRLGEYDEPQPDLALIRRDATPGSAAHRRRYPPGHRGCRLLARL